MFVARKFNFLLTKRIHQIVAIRTSKSISNVQNGKMVNNTRINGEDKTIINDKLSNQKEMAYNFDWVFPLMANPSKLWYIASAITITAVGLFSKLVLVLFNKAQVHNKNRLIDAIYRPRGIPLVTVSNHHSCFDDPGIWGSFTIRDVLNRRSIRWALAAHDICFTCELHSVFFMWGKCIPCVRGDGVYQPAIDLCIQKVTEGEWVHVFPEGKVNMTKEFLRFKWGVGRIIYESPIVPIILPIWHEGMETILPNEPPYYLRFGKKVTVNYGKPIDLNDLIADLKKRDVKEPEARKIITDKIQESLTELQRETEELHKAYLKC